MSAAKEITKEYGNRNDVEANDLFRKVKSIKSEQTMDGDILVLEERQAYNEAHQSHAYLLNMKQREQKRDSGPHGSPSQISG